MHRGTAISAPFALAHFLFLPVTYSMIFHRGAPNFTYAQEGADNNVSTVWVVNSSDITFDVVEDYNVSTLLWILNSSAVTMGVVEDKSISTLWIPDRSAVAIDVIVEDNDVSTTRVADNSNMSTDSTSDQNYSPSSSPVYVDVVEDYNISTLWIENSSTSTTDLVEDDFSTSRVVDTSTAFVTSNSYLVNVDILEDHNVSMSWVNDSLTVTTGIAEENINKSWITGSSTITEDLTSDYYISLDSSTVDVEDDDDNNASVASIADSTTVTLYNVGENIINTSWTASPSTMTIGYATNNNVSPTSDLANVEVEDKEVITVWIADGSRATSETLEENTVITPWTTDSSNVAKDVTSDNTDSLTSTTSVGVENVEDSSVSSTWTPSGTSIVTISSPTDTDVSTSLSTVNLELVEVPDNNVSVVWNGDSSTVTVELVEDDNVSAKWVTDSTSMTVDYVEDHNTTPLWVVNGFEENAEEDEEWGGMCRDGKMQSPIHITTFTTEVNAEAQPIIFINYDLASLEASITLHTIKFDPKPNAPGYQIGIAGGGLMGFYELNHIHLHWANSEHAIDHNSYKMEAHLVHFKAPYGNWSADDILDQPDGIAVLAVLFELGTADPTIEDLILNLGRDLPMAEMPKVTPRSFLPDNTDEYIRYRGSLTTPPCSEVVVWTVFPSSKTLTEYQVKWLSTRKLKAGIPDPANYRPLQDRNHREVLMMKASYSINLVPGHLASPEKGHASYTAPSIALMLATISLFSFRLC